MTVVRLDHVYVSVSDMNRAIKFYETLLGTSVKNREENTWADFDVGNGCYFGLINPKIISDRRVVGNNSIPVFYSDDVDVTFEIIKNLGVKINFAPKNLDFTDYFYHCFECEDTEGNLIEVAQYDKDKVK